MVTRPPPSVVACKVFGSNFKVTVVFFTASSGEAAAAAAAAAACSQGGVKGGGDTDRGSGSKVTVFSVTTGDVGIFDNDPVIIPVSMSTTASSGAAAKQLGRRSVSPTPLPPPSMSIKSFPVIDETEVLGRLSDDLSGGAAGSEFFSSFSLTPSQQT